MNLFYLISGLALLTLGGEGLIRGALAAAKSLGISPLLSGLVIVGFGTSAPELVVSIDAILNQQPEIAIGNVIGSNIGNILLILGVCALISPLTVKSITLRRDALVVVMASALFIFSAAGKTLVFGHGLMFLIALLIYLFWAYKSESSKVNAPSGVYEAEAVEVQPLPKSNLITGLYLLIGLFMLIAGSQLFLKGAVGIGQYFGVPETILGLTLVAIGTSLPEFTISIIATLRGHTEVAIGNVLGSNIFNLLGILGFASIIQPLPVQLRIVQIDQWVMLGSSVLLFIFLYTGRRLNRVEGTILLLIYSAYIAMSLYAP